MKLWLKIVALALLVAACGGGADGGVDAGVIASPDGRATLELPEGSLPEGTSSEDLSLKVVSIETSEVGEPLMVIQLLPHGLILQEPATLSFQIPEEAQSGFVVVHQSGDWIEFVTGEVKQSADGPSFTTQVAHFSTVHLSLQVSPFETTIAVDPVVVSKDADQTAMVTVVDDSKLSSIWLKVTRGESDTWTLFEFSTPSKVGTPTGAYVAWGTRGQAPWDASINKVDVLQGGLGWKVEDVTSTCLEPNTTDVWFMAAVEYDLRIVARGEPVEKPGLSVFAGLFGDEPVPQTDLNPRTRLSDLAPGDTIHVVSAFGRDTTSVCTEVPSTTTAGSATTTTVVRERVERVPYVIDVSEQDGSVEVDADDCYTLYGPANCSAGLDITGVAWAYVEGSPNLLEITVTYAGPIDSSTDLHLGVGVRVSDRFGIGAGYEMRDGEISLSFPSKDGALPGELVELRPDGQLVVVIDVSELTGVLKVKASAIDFATDGARDDVQLINVLER